MKNITGHDMVILENFYKGVVYGSKEHIEIEKQVKALINKYGLNAVLSELEKTKKEKNDEYKNSSGY